MIFFLLSRSPSEVDRRSACPWIPRSSRGMTEEENRGMTEEENRGMTEEENHGMTEEENRGMTEEENRGMTEEENHGMTENRPRGIGPLSSSRKLLTVGELASRSASFIRDPSEVNRRHSPEFTSLPRAIATGLFSFLLVTTTYADNAKHNTAKDHHDAEKVAHQQAAQKQQAAKQFFKNGRYKKLKKYHPKPLFKVKGTDNNGF